jgi:uncharacterized protein YecT (DUF1311 family)
MTNSRAFSMFILVAAFLPLHPKLALASAGYVTFAPTAAQLGRLTSATYKVCMDNSNGNTANINECSDAEYGRLDGRLNRSYQAALRRLSPTNARALRSDERGWIATRSDKCLADLKEEREGGGTIYSILIRDCTLQELKRRILWIETRR